MFDSLKHWFESIKEGSKLFDDPDDEMLHSALASVLYHVISADAHVIGKEKNKFEAILKKEFELNDEQIEHLYQAAKTSASDIHSDLHTINLHLKQTPLVRMNFMQQIVQLADANGLKKENLDVFYETLHEIFPEVKDLKDDESL
jgi:uncharacterized tellurite resistance protein B-like protein